MRLHLGTLVFLLSITLYFAASPANGQVVTEGPDSVRVPVADTLNVGHGFFLSKWDKPAKAALLSAALPGLGQVYNKSYWKLPIIYATGAVLGYFLIDNNTKYQDYRKALILRVDNDSTTIDKFVDDPILGAYRGQIAVDNLRLRRDYYRRNRDLTILLSIAAYGLNIAEAYVHAHLKEFDVSEDLSLQIQPNIMHLPANQGLAPAFTLTLYTKSR
jgi:hypothetical protein